MSASLISKGLCLVYFLAFASLYIQLPGLTDWKWTALLIEAGFIGFLYLFASRKNSKHGSGTALWLFRWLLFREAFSVGFAALSNTKLPWYNLSGMDHYFSSQISPTPASWYLANLPNSVLRVFAMIVVTMKVFISFLYLVPLCEIRYVVFFINFMYHGNFLITGNDGIYSLILLVASIALLPQPKQRPIRRSTVRKFLSITLSLAILVAVIYSIYEFFGLANGIEQAKITVPRNVLISYGKNAVTYVIPIACVLFGLTVIIDIVGAFSARGFTRKMMDVNAAIIVGILGSGLFLASLPPLSSVADSISIVKLPRFTYELSQTLQPFHLSNDYRFFNRNYRDVVMKTTDKRSTLVLEGAIAEKGPWKEIAFHNLPSVVDKVPSFIPGHMPVLDFEVAISGEKSLENSPLVATLVYRLLTGQKEVLPLVGDTGFPAGIKYIQIKKYDYTVTDNTGSKQWWQRTLKNIYLPPTDVSNQRLKQLMNKLGIAGKQRPRPLDPNAISTVLDKLRAMVGQPANLNGFYVVLAVVLVVNRIFF